MANKILILSILLMNIFCSIYSQTSKSCEDKMTCDDCIGAEGCSWCKVKNVGTFQRCNTVEGHKKNQDARCSNQDNIVTAGPPSRSITKNDPITKSMRIMPQQVSATLPVKKELTVELTYRDGTDKALDLYYIMDLSATMENDKDTVSAQAADLVQALRKITKDVKLGFGAFVDKPVLPFVSSSHLRPNNEYAIPYGFKNWLSLSSETTQFQRVVNATKISRNLDEPEGTLDALMQAILCKNEIGWRNTSRKLIVVATDGPFHIAGDGKLGGIVIPNDMKCHMKNNTYTHSKLLDYPSIGEINAVILQEKVFVIFAVSTQESNEQFEIYKDLAKHISQSTAVLLKENSENVVQEIQKKYLEISQKVQLFVEDKPPFVDVKVYAQCSTSGGFVPQDFCNGVGVNSAIKFKITLTLNECPKFKSPSVKDRVVISFFELTKQEKLIIDLSYDCSCSCNSEMHQDNNDLTKFCNGVNASNSISCGICNCKEGRSGQACQCYVTESGETEQGNNEKCINPKQGNQGILCSNRGQCKCGQCECDKGTNNKVVEWNGKYCEDSTSKCQNKNSQYNSDLCSGNGRCEKGKCNCNPGYDGDFCECQISNKQLCIEPGQSSKSPYCNGQGTCACGVQEAQCKCNPGYGGAYCGVCKIKCPTGEAKLGSRCRDEFLTTCIRCRINSRKADKSKKQLSESESQCSAECDWTKRQPEAKKEIRAEVSEVRFKEEDSRASLSNQDGAECRIKVNDCTSVFKYAYTRSHRGGSDTLDVYFTADGLTCPKEPPILWYVFGTILGVLLIGIFGLLIWKLATYLHDTREYQRFEKERAGAKFQGGENPLYSKPVSETQNPTYRG